MNTPLKGQFRYIVFQDDNVWYAVALEFNIVESSDDPKLALFNLFQAVDGYIESSKKIHGSRYQFLNQVADKEYTDLWYTLNNEPIKSPFWEATPFNEILVFTLYPDKSDKSPEFIISMMDNGCIFSP